MLEDGAHISFFHDVAAVHHCHSIHHRGHDAQVVGDKNDGGAQLFVYGPEQVQDLGLDSYIQGGGGLIRDEQLRVAQKSDGRS